MMSCENCARITQTENVEYVIHTVFGNLEFQADVCDDCKASMNYAVRVYTTTTKYLIQELAKKSFPTHKL